MNILNRCIGVRSELAAFAAIAIVAIAPASASAAANNHFGVFCLRNPIDLSTELVTSAPTQ